MPAFSLEEPADERPEVGGPAAPSGVCGGQDLPRNFIRLAAGSLRVRRRRCLPRLALMIAAGVVGGVSFLSVPLHRGCAAGLVAVKFEWFALDYFLCLSYCTVAYIATFNGLYPGAHWATWCATWFAIVFFQAVAVSFCWRSGAVGTLFAITIGAASTYEITLFILLAYTVRFWFVPRWAGAAGPRGPASPPVGSFRWEAVEAKIRNTQFEEEAAQHALWLEGLPSADSPALRVEASGERPSVIRRPEHQLLLCCIFMLCLSAWYPVCNAVFQAVLRDRTGPLGTFAGLSAFSFCAWAAKTALSSVGFVCDAGVVDASFSGYYAGQFLGSFYYYSYYRAMSEHVSGWSDFAALQFAHLALEWMQHVARATDWYYRWARGVTSSGPRWFQKVTLTIFLSRQPNVSSEDWARFMAVDTSLQAFVIGASLLAYATGYTVLRYVDSARVSFRPFVDHMADQQYNKLMLQLAVQVFTEVFSIGLMDVWFRRRLGGPGALRRFPLLFENRSFFVFVLAWCTLHGANPWIQWMPKQFCGAAALHGT